MKCSEFSVISHGGISYRLQSPVSSLIVRGDGFLSGVEVWSGWRLEAVGGRVRRPLNLAVSVAYHTSSPPPPVSSLISVAEGLDAGDGGEFAAGEVKLDTQPIAEGIGVISQPRIAAKQSVRAGLCDNPEEDYRWWPEGGQPFYAAAVAGEPEARRGLAHAFGRVKWTAKLAGDYRMLLFGQGQEVVGGATPRGYVAPKRGFARERVREELEKFQ